MAPTKTAKITVVQHPEDIWMAMLDLLPVSIWNELFNEVAKTHYWRYQFRDCTNFKVVE